MWTVDIPNAARDAHEAKLARLYDLEHRKTGRTFMETFEMEQMRADYNAELLAAHAAMVARRSEPFWSPTMVGMVVAMSAMFLVGVVYPIVGLAWILVTNVLR